MAMLGADDAGNESPYSQLLQGGAPAAAPQMPPAQPGGYLGITQPQSTDVSTIIKPAGSPEEVTARKEQWKGILDHPHFNNALMMMGAALSQPKQIGQTNAGMIGNAAMTGVTALKAGEYSDYKTGMEQREQGRKEAETGANVENTMAGAANTRAKTPGTAAQSKVEEGTVDARITSAKTEAEKALVGLKKAKNQQEVDNILTDFEKKKATVLAGLDEGETRKAATSELDKVHAEIERIKKQGDYFGAETREKNAKAGIEEMTADTLKGMEGEERKAFLTKSGKFAHNVSALSAQRDMWNDIYDKLPGEHASKKGVTKEEFVMKKLTEAKSQDALKELSGYLRSTMDPDPDIVRLYSDLAKSGAAARKGEAPASQTSGGIIKWAKDPKTGKIAPVPEGK